MDRYEEKKELPLSKLQNCNLRKINEQINLN